MDKFFFTFGLFCAVIISYLHLNEAKQKMTQEGLKEMEDASEITWAHAVNSRADLSRELAGKVDFLEADVSMGYLNVKPQGAPMPVMVHPPLILSDISLEDWIATVILTDAGKGVKLDFKSLDVVEESLRILHAWTTELNFTLWLNADILKGPINPDSVPVKDSAFLMLCNKYFPTAVLSVGWTTNFVPSHPASWHYEWKHVRKMADSIKCFGYGNNFPTVTFPVRGIFASRSLKQLQWLLGVIPGSSLTIWSDKRDPLQVEDLIRIRMHFPKNRVFYDLPERLQTAFLKVKHTVEPYPYLQNQKNDQWLTLTHRSDHTCESNTYVGNNTILFGKSLTTAVLHKKLLFVDGSQSLKVTGKVCFFTEQTSGDMGLTIVLTDVSLFSKNSSTNSESNLSLAESDTNVLWEAINGSHLHTFRHDLQDTVTNCHIFRLDTSLDKCFQAWKFSQEDADDNKPSDELIKSGIPEVSNENKMALPTHPFMIGFVFSGDGHAAVYDFEIEGKKQSISGTLPVSTLSIKFVGLICFSVLVGYFMKNCFS